MGTSEQYTPLEFEAIGLSIVARTIDSIVNREALELLGPKDRTEVMLPTGIHQKFFYIIVGDFLSEKTDVSLTQEKTSCIGLLDKICNRPLLEINESATDLREAHQLFKGWLDIKVERNIWTPSLNREIQLSLTRKEIITIAANMSKHHFGHLTAITKKIHKLLGDEIQPRHKLIPALEEIYTDLHDNVLNYHASTIVEMLNNIRWGIHEYLKPEFDRAYHKTDGILYDFLVPGDIKSDFGVACYWELMNSVRSRPYVQKFTANEILKVRY